MATDAGSFESRVIAIDFDGTLVAHKYPEIGREIPFAFEVVLALQKKGFRLILWTFRAGSSLEEAITYCREKGLDFYAVNMNFPEEVFEEGISRKIHADIYIDDRNLGGLPDWVEIYQMLCPEEPETAHFNKRRGLLSRLFGK